MSSSHAVRRAEPVDVFSANIWVPGDSEVSSLQIAINHFWRFIRGRTVRSHRLKSSVCEWSGLMTWIIVSGVSHIHWHNRILEKRRQRNSFAKQSLLQVRLLHWWLPHWAVSTNWVNLSYSDIIAIFTSLERIVSSPMTIILKTNALTTFAIDSYRLTIVSPTWRATRPNH